jgi:hypothetical protein
MVDGHTTKLSQTTIASHLFDPEVDPVQQCAFVGRHARALEHVYSRIRRSCERGLFSGNTPENL